jgi:hypothetical protein
VQRKGFDGVRTGHIGHVIYQGSSAGQFHNKVPANERVIIDTALDKLHSQDKFEWITKSTFYIFSVFVVWRTLYKDGILIRKNRIVVDIREFNKAAVSDAYFIPLQSDIIKTILDYKYISVINGIDFFY